MTSQQSLDNLWAHHHAEWRDPMHTTALWQPDNAIMHNQLNYEVYGDWWNILGDAGMTLLATREYENFVIAMNYAEGQPDISYLRLPHPSGMVFNHKTQTLHVAATRNPNQILDIKPVQSVLARQDIPYKASLDRHELMPSLSRFYPGSLYIHDLAIIDDKLYANAVGHNSVVILNSDGSYSYVWHPKCIEVDGQPIREQNHIQLNSIASGDALETSFFSASSNKISSRRPGHKNYPVDGRGVIFSGLSREVIAQGLTRPHSARLHQDKIWVDNSGYGELVIVEDGQVEVISRLPGWTRGLVFHNQIAFVGTSRVISRFKQYAPGLDVEHSQCGIHAVDILTGQILGGIIWDIGNQIFAIELVPFTISYGFPFRANMKRKVKREQELFYSYQL